MTVSLQEGDRETYSGSYQMLRTAANSSQDALHWWFKVDLNGKKLSYFWLNLH